MSTEVFVGDVYHTAIRDGKDLWAGETIAPGTLCLVTSGSLATLADTAETPVGVAYGARQQVYRPTSKSFASGEAMVLLKGYFVCYYSDDFFANNPSPGDTLYMDDDGFMDTSGSVAVGRCERVFTRTEEVGGVGTSQTLYEIAFDLVP